jgi:hypothetical protein
MTDKYFQKSAQDFLTEEFKEAVLNGDTSAVEAMFEKEIKPYIDVEIVTAPAILIAAQQENWEMVSLLYSLNADLDVKLTTSGWTLLDECIACAPDYVTHTLIEYCDLNLQTDSGETPLMVAIRKGKLETAQKLLDTESLDLSLIDENNENIGHYLARAGLNELFLKVIEMGVPLMQKNKQGQTSMDLISDMEFRLALPDEIQKMADRGKNIILQSRNNEDKETQASVANSGAIQSTQVNTTENQKPEVDTSVQNNQNVTATPKVSGLSAIKKKV